MNDPAYVFAAQLLADRGGLRATQRAELKAGQVTVEEAVRVLDVGVPDDVDARAQVTTIVRNRAGRDL